MNNYPDQPIVRDADGFRRFKQNTVVRYLLDNGGITLNDIANVNFPKEDLEQFYQLIGYSVCGFCELDFVSADACSRVSRSYYVS